MADYWSGPSDAAAIHIAGSLSRPCPWVLDLSERHGDPELALRFPQGGIPLNRWPEIGRSEVTWSLAYHCPDARPEGAVIFGAVTTSVAEIRFQPNHGSVLSVTLLPYRE